MPHHWTMVSKLIIQIIATIVTYSADPVRTSIKVQRNNYTLGSRSFYFQQHLFHFIKSRQLGLIHVTMWHPHSETLRECSSFHCQSYINVNFHFKFGLVPYFIQVGIWLHTHYYQSEFLMKASPLHPFNSVDKKLLLFCLQLNEQSDMFY